MRAALTLLVSVCLSTISSSPLDTVEVEVSGLAPQERNGRGIADASFWCPIHRPNCVVKCAGRLCGDVCVISSWLYTCQEPSHHSLDNLPLNNKMLTMNL